MNHGDIHKYLSPALINLGYNLRISDADELEKLLGKREYKDYPRIETPIDEEYKQLLIALAGPHGRTILKAIQARRGDNDDRT